MYKYLLCEEKTKFADEMVKWFEGSGVRGDKYEDLLMDIHQYCEKWTPYLFRREKTIKVRFNPQDTKINTGYQSYSYPKHTRKVRDNLRVATIGLGYEIGSDQYKRFKRGLYAVLDEHRRDNDYQFAFNIDKMVIEGRGYIKNFQFNRTKPKPRKARHPYMLTDENTNIILI